MALTFGRPEGRSWVGGHYGNAAGQPQREISANQGTVRTPARTPRR